MVAIDGFDVDLEDPPGNVERRVRRVGGHRLGVAGLSPSTIRNRRDEWINLGLLAQLKAIALDAYDRTWCPRPRSSAVARRFGCSYGCSALAEVVGHTGPADRGLACAP